MSSNERIEITKNELNLALEFERIKTIQEIDGKKYEKHIESTEPLLRKILKEIQVHPHKLTLCRNELKKEVEDEFMTKKEAMQMETRIESKIETVRTKLTWALSIVIFIVTLGSQLAIKLIGV